jgi:hypothetical protein
LATTNYLGTTLSQTTAAQRATLKVAANNVSITFAQTLPNLSVSYSGFANNEGTSVLSGSPSVTTTATSYSLPGTYPITVGIGTLSATNYSFVFVNGTLTINPTGTAPASPTSCNGAYTGTFSGSILVAPYQVCEIDGGVVKGGIVSTGGIVVLNNASVSGAVGIGGSASGPGVGQQHSICGSNIGGSLIVLADGDRVAIGGAAGTSCTTNTFGGDIQVLSSSGAATIGYNTVKGNLLLEFDSGAVQVLDNKITKTLACSGDTNISGSGNTAASKQGQCAKF